MLYLFVEYCIRTYHTLYFQMSEPVPSGGTPGPLIGGVFGGLVVVAASVVIGFFAYKR